MLLDRVDWIIGPGDRIGVVGANGSGKTTLLRLLIGAGVPDSRVVLTGSTVRLGYLSQEVAELPGALRLIEAVSEVSGSVDLGGRTLTAGQLAERFGFTSAQQWTPVADLSGGERRRLQLLRILMAEPNVLVLDEPTNDLDVDTLAALEDLLDSWPGTLLVVSHDRYLVERVADTVMALFGDGRLTHLPGGVQQYLDRKASSSAAPAASPVPAADPGGSDPVRRRELRKNLQRLDRQLDALHRKESELHNRMAEAAADFATAADLARELDQVRAQVADVEIEWMTAAEELEES